MNKEVEYFKTRLKLLMLENKEYKINLLMGIVSNIMLFITIMIFYFIVGDLFLREYGFRNIDFVLMFMLLMFSSLSWRLFSNKDISRHLKTGEFNKMLILPINTFVFQTPLSIKGVGLVNMMITCSIAAIILIFNYSYENYVYGLIVLFLGNLFQFAVLNALFSLSFFIKENLFLHRLYYGGISSSIEEFTPIAFSQSPIFVIMALLPVSIYGFWAVEAFKGNLQMFNLVIMASCIGIVVFSFTTYFNWKYGLRRYEAFGG